MQSRSAVRWVRAVGLAGLVAMVMPAVASAAAGDLDPSFGTGGVTLAQFAPPTFAVTDGIGEAIAPNGDVYLVGSVATLASPGAVMVARYLPTGVLDPTFGTGGVSIQQIGQATVGVNASGNETSLYQPVALTPSGEIIVPTQATDPSGGAELAVAEFTPAGALDPSFGTGGVYYDDSISTASPKTAYAFGAAVQSNGKIVITANANGATTATAYVQRLNANGTLDTSFAATDPSPSSPGTYAVTSPEASAVQFTGVTVDSAQNIVFTGIGFIAGNSAYLVDSLNPSGQVNPGFPVLTQGSTAATPGSFGFAVMQAADGDYVAVGGAIGASNVSQFSALAVKPTGAVDTAFGGRGNGAVAFGPPGLFTPASSVVQQANGRFVLDGGVLSAVAAATIGRLLPDGTPDQSFGAGGITTLQLPGPASVFGAAIAPDGQLIVSGQANAAGGAPSTSGLLAKITLDTPPSLLVTSAPSAPVVGEAVSFSAAALDDASTPTLSWDLGSGSFADATGPTTTRTFTTPGTYTVRVRATDDDNHSTVQTQTVTVAAAPPPAPPTTTTTTTTTTVTTPTTVVLPAPRPASECTNGSRPTATIKAKLLLTQGLLVAGTAAAHCPNAIASVGIAVARVNGKKCGFLSRAHRWGKYGRCTAPKSYLRATGTYSWAFVAKLKFAKGTYWLWPQAVDDHRAATLNTAAHHIALKVKG